MPASDRAADAEPGADTLATALGAARPPGQQRAQQTTADELLRELNRVPLFMTSLDESDGAGGENVLLEAMRALAHEGPRADVAANFREQGNECARARRWADAREYYSKALLALRQDEGGEGGVAPDEDEARGPAAKVVDVEAEARREREIEEACYANRALCNLEMKNYGSCNRDCAAALSLNPRNVKAWFRAGSACLALDKTAEAVDACASGLRFDAANAPLQALLAKAEKRRHYVAQLQRDRAAREEKARQEMLTLQLALRTRNIRVRETGSPPDMEDAAVGLADPSDAASALAFPLLFLYPLHAQTDLIKAVGEHESLAQHLEYILPVPWDEKAEYRTNCVDCYMETTEGGLIKAGKKLGLVKLLGSGRVEVVDGLVRVYVVPTARASEWIEQFKQRRGKS